MKKILLLLLSFVMIFSLASGLISCGKEEVETKITPNLNAEYAKEHLESAGYKVIYTSGVQASIMDSAAIAIISASKGSDKIDIVYYNDVSSASSAYANMVNDYQIDKEIAENFGKEFNDIVGTAQNSVNGVYLVYRGTENAINASK